MHYKTDCHTVNSPTVASKEQISAAAPLNFPLCVLCWWSQSALLLVRLPWQMFLMLLLEFE